MLLRAALGCLGVACILPLWAASPPTEYEVKAAYLYNFGKYVKWPGGGGGREFSICVLGRDPFGAMLDKMVTGETIGGATAQVKRISSAADADGCRIVFVAASERWHLGELLPELNHDSALTVSDIPDFATRGGMIEFVLQDDRVRFRINLAAAQNAGLNLSSELLKVASAVKEH